MKKINFIRANKTKHGGAEVYLSRLSEQLKNLDIKHELIHSKIPKILPSWLRVLLFNYQVCNVKQDDEIYFSLERISCPDIYRAGDGVHKVFLKTEQKSKTNPLHFVYLSIEKKMFQNTKKIIANSNMIKQQIINTYNIDENKIEVIYNGIKLDTFDFDYSKKKLSKEFDINLDDNKIFLYVGSGFKRKGVEEFLTILSKLKYKNFKAFIVGKEKNLFYYHSLVKQFNLDQHIIFTGARDDVKDFYTISDIFLFPTRYEPFSNVVLEAMLYANVVITTKQNGASEILDDNLVMNTPDDYNIVEKIDNILNNQDLLDKIKNTNLLLVQDFSIEKNVEKTLKVIDEVIC